LFPLSWIILIVAGVLEVAWALTLPATQGFTKLPQTIAFLVLLAGSMYGLAVATRSIPIGTAYAVWVGIGAVGTVALGIVLKGEPASFTRVLALAALVASIVAVKVTANS
jgi:quaternary ammonium compound-resistance protein SugE